MKTALIRGTTAIGLIGTLTIGGCGTELDEEDVDVSTSAFTASQCAAASPAATFAGAYVWASATNYSTACNAVDETTGGSSLFLPYGSQVNPNKLPTTQSACESVTIRSTFYKKSGSTWVLAKDESHAGVWGPLPFGAVGCSLPGTSFPPPGGGIDVRVATTVRRPSGASFVTLPFTTSLQRKPR